MQFQHNKVDSRILGSFTAASSRSRDLFTTMSQVTVFVAEFQRIPLEWKARQPYDKDHSEPTRAMTWKHQVPSTGLHKQVHGVP
jgi:hypothetical protein